MAGQMLITPAAQARRVLRFVFLSLMMSGGSLASVPAPLIGIWQLEAPAQPAGPSGAAPTVQLTLSSGALRGAYGCGRFSGRFEASGHRVALSASMLPPAPNERCTFAMELPFIHELNASTRYVVSRDHLLLFSGKQRLTFRRIGFVTPERN
ncbi:META domain-containing protein [Deinococcus pimensis]|uniref:META domain-containing protein n=1 Tax=Deinococcus pimensis TaxID=309888 RepID=UPI0012F838D7|nr:META domain-containing protein [Deinococcus pimensis]